MYLRFRKTKRGPYRSRINYSKSGVSVSKSFGPFTINTRGDIHLRLGHGFSVKIR